MTGEMLSALIELTIGETLMFVLRFFLLRVLLRREWLAAAVFLLLLGWRVSASKAVTP